MSWLPALRYLTTTVIHGAPTVALWSPRSTLCMIRNFFSSTATPIGEGVTRGATLHDGHQLMPPIAGSAASTGSIGGDNVPIFMLNSAQDASAVRATDHSLDWEGSQYSSRHRDSIELRPRPGRREELAPLILSEQSWSARDHSPLIFDSSKNRKEYRQRPQCLD